MTYGFTWRNKWLTWDVTTIEEMADTLEAASAELRDMARHGVVLDPDSGVRDDYATLTTDDPKVAEEFGFELLEPDEGDDESEVNNREFAEID